MSYTIMGFPRTRAIRVMWLLEELGQSYDIDPAMPASDEAKAVNPTGKVPALIDNGHVIPDSVAICTYLADKHGGCTHPAGTVERALQDSFTQFCVDEVEGALWTHAKHTFVLPEELRVEAPKQTAAKEFARAMDRLEARLGDGPFVTGETFTVPDLLLAHCSSWARMLPQWPIESERLNSYFKSLIKRPAYIRTQERAAKYTA
ncbi:MAG: glutathione S-transferase family protein [Pseudomonadota bacterium]